MDSLHCAANQPWRISALEETDGKMRSFGWIRNAEQLNVVFV